MADDPAAISDNEASRVVRQPVGGVERAPATGRHTEAVREKIANLVGIRRCCWPHPEARTVRLIAGHLAKVSTFCRGPMSAPRQVRAGGPLRDRSLPGVNLLLSGHLRGSSKRGWTHARKPVSAKTLKCRWSD